MKVAELIRLLENYHDDMHVLIQVSPASFSDVQGLFELESNRLQASNGQSFTQSSVVVIQ